MIDKIILSGQDLPKEGLLSLPLSFAEAQDASFARQESDLVIKSDALEITVKDYFLSASDLLVSDGGALKADFIANFIEQPAKLTAALNSGGENMVATVSNLSGDAWARPHEGGMEKLSVGTAIEEGSEILTGKNSKVTLLLEDGSTFSLGARARISMDELQFDADSSSGSMFFSVIRGIFSFASGLIARDEPQNVVLRTPTAEIGLRGTKLVGEVSEGGASKIGLVDGRMVVKTNAGEIMLDKPFLQTVISDLTSPPSKPSNFDFSSFAGLKELFDSAQDLREFQSAPDGTRPNPALAKDSSDQLPAADTPPSAGESQLLTLPDDATEDTLLASASSLGSSTVDSVTKILIDLNDQYDLNIAGKALEKVANTFDAETVLQGIGLLEGFLTKNITFTAALFEKLDQAILLMESYNAAIAIGSGEPIVDVRLIDLIKDFNNLAKNQDLDLARDFLENSVTLITELIGTIPEKESKDIIEVIVKEIYKAANLDFEGLSTPSALAEADPGYTVAEDSSGAQKVADITDTHQS